MNNHHSQRQAILEQMEEITHMERGHLSEEYRLGSDGQRKGPYYKHQAWQKGCNHSCRVPAEQVEAMRKALAGHERFRQLADEYVEATVAMTRAGLGDDCKKKARSSPGRAVKKAKGSST